MTVGRKVSYTAYELADLRAISKGDEKVVCLVAQSVDDLDAGLVDEPVANLAISLA